MTAIHVAKLRHITPGADQAIAEIARVSNPQNQNNRETAGKLIRYMINHNHWSPFETVHATVEVVTTRDIGRQILRHRSFTFQEFSGRYAAYGSILHEKMMRYQDPTNRQSSIIPDSDLLVDASTKESKDWVWWCNAVDRLAAQADDVYTEALNRGVAKECARAVLPEGLVPTRLYMCGPIRSFIHYAKERLDSGVQFEHQLVAGQVFWQVFSEMPMLLSAITENGYIDPPSVAQAYAHGVLE